MMKQFSLLMVAGVFVASASLTNPAFGCMGDESCGNCKAGADKAAIMAAVEKGDYEGWKKLTAGQDCPMAAKITAENFPRMAEAHKLMKAGKTEEARAIKAELRAAAGEEGCPHHAKMKGHGKGHKAHKGHKGHKGGCANCNH